MSDRKQNRTGETETQETLFGEFMDVIRTLMGPEGCPWDRQQTHESLKRYLIEEAYEVYEAVDSGSSEALADELGDVLLQVALHAELGRVSGRFAMEDVLRGIRDKMIRRHPHVFALGDARTPAQVEAVWEEIKKTEKTAKKSLMDMPRNMPALYRAEKIQKRATRIGFQWDSVEGILEKLQEEIEELQEALPGGNRMEITGELGDILFTAANLCTFLGVDPSEALQGTNDTFIRRFRYMEETSREEGVLLENLTQKQMDRYWEEAKKRKDQGFLKDSEGNTRGN